MNKRLLIIVAAAAFLCGLILQVPATHLYRFIQPDPQSGIGLLGPQGTLSEGRLAAVTARGRPLLNNLHWTFKPLWLLLGQRVFALNGQFGDTPMTTRLRISPFGTTSFSAFQADLPLERLLALSGKSFLPVEGQIHLGLDSVQFSGSRLKTLVGSGQLRGFSWKLAKPAIQIGDFDAVATTDGDTILINITSPSGAVEASGTVKLTPDGRYQIDLQYRARAQADAVLRNLIASVGTPDSLGWTHYRAQGQL